MKRHAARFLYGSLLAPELARPDDAIERGAIETNPP
jgi:hypothetical protein